MKRYLFVCVFLLSVVNFCFAGNVPGFIVTLSNDTLWGVVQVSRFNQLTGAFVVGGIETESFYSRVVFRSDAQSHFESYFPEMLNAFGFAYKEKLFFFESKNIKHKSIFRRETQQRRFVKVLYSDELGRVYRDVYYLPNPSLNSNFERFVRFDSYYLHEKCAY